MKRDMDLIRGILMQVEEKGKPGGSIDIEIEDHSPEEVSYHVQLLAVLCSIYLYAIIGERSRPTRRPAVCVRAD